MEPGRECTTCRGSVSAPGGWETRVFLVATATTRVSRDPPTTCRERESLPHQLPARFVAEPSMRDESCSGSWWDRRSRKGSRSRDTCPPQLSWSQDLPHPPVGDREPVVRVLVTESCGRLWPQGHVVPHRRSRNLPHPESLVPEAPHVPWKRLMVEVTAGAWDPCSLTREVFSCQAFIAHLAGENMRSQGLTSRS